MSEELRAFTDHITQFRGVLLQTLERLSDEQLSWKPFEKFRTLGQMIYHIARAKDSSVHGIVGGDWSMRRVAPPEHLCEEHTPALAPVYHGT